MVLSERPRGSTSKYIWKCAYEYVCTESNFIIPAFRRQKDNHKSQASQGYRVRLCCGEGGTQTPLSGKAVLATQPHRWGVKVEVTGAQVPETSQASNVTRGISEEKEISCKVI